MIDLNRSYAADGLAPTVETSSARSQRTEEAATGTRHWSSSSSGAFEIRRGLGLSQKLDLQALRDNSASVSRQADGELDETGLLAEIRSKLTSLKDQIFG